MNKMLLGAAVLASAVSTQAMAGPNWNELSISYLSVDTDNGDVDGFGVSGSKLLNSTFFIGGSYANFSEDTGYFGVDLDTNFLSLGIGARKAVAANTDIYGVLSYEYAEQEYTAGYLYEPIDDVSGYGLTAGVRTMMTPNFELNAAVVYTDLDDVTDTGFTFGASYHFNNKFAVGASFGTTDDVDTLALTGTMKF